MVTPYYFVDRLKIEVRTTLHVLSLNLGVKGCNETSPKMDLREKKLKIYSPVKTSRWKWIAA